MFLAACGMADTYVRQPSVDVIHYDISMEVTGASDSIAGIAMIQVLIRSEAASGMWLDFEDMAIEKLLVGGNDRRFTYGGGRLTFDFDRAYSRNEIALVEVRYHGIPKDGLCFEKNRYGRRVIFADNWPNRAHHWFPSIDHPSDKATVSFKVTAPDKYDVVSNGRLAKTVSLADGRRLTQWDEGKTIPTYCMVVGIAEFSITHPAKISRVPLAWYAYPQDSEIAARKFSRTESILAYFNDLIGPYPYEKLAQVQSVIRTGAMENSSAIFYGEPAFMGTPVSEEPVAHEIAHQWFGDSVTESDWDDLWLSEGFATYLEAQFYGSLKGPGTLNQTMALYAKRIMDYKPALSEPIVDPAQTDLMKKLNRLNYEKGAWVLHMLRGILGDDVFFEGIRRYYRLYEGGNASSEDFQKAMESTSGTALGEFFHEWLYQPGWPEYRIRWHWNESAGELEISIQQAQNSGLFDMPLEIAVSVEGRKELYKFRINSAHHTFQVALRSKPLAIEADPSGWVLKTVSISPY